MQPQLLITSDSSHTLYHPQLNETYHSKSGAIGESQYVYIDSGLAYKAHNQDTLAIFEFGFGTGLNALLTWMFAENNNKKIVYDSVEKYPLGIEINEQLNYGHQLLQQDKFATLHNLAWDETFILSSHFVFHKYFADIFQFTFPHAYYDVVYFDAFAPSKQSEVWAIELLEKIHHSLRPSGILITYCSQGQFKRNLKAVGFELEMLPGPFKKKEITRAVKK